MKSTHLLASTVLFLSAQSFAAQPNTLIQTDATASVYETVVSIKAEQLSKKISPETAINRLFTLGASLKKQADGIGDIIDALGDLGAT